jgi:ketosteroid isomerase-like protein
MRSLLLIPLLLLISQISFSSPKFSAKNFRDAKDELKQADIDFSNLSKEKGMNFAFLEYVADDGVLLRPFTYPIVGKDNISKEMLSNDDKNLQLTWAPLYGDVAASGEMGYTYGTYEMKIKKEDGTEDVRKGTYVSIWKKDKAGKWKFVLDTGNPGLEPKQ